MKANELRIGNLMHFPFTAENVMILGINAHEYKSEIINTISFEKEENLYCEKLKVLKPILLTEGWLLKLGLTKIGSEYIRYNQLRCFGIKKKESEDYFTYSTLNSNMITIVKSVHQLQNLYFALTGEELMLKSI